MKNQFNLVMIVVLWGLTTVRADVESFEDSMVPMGWTTKLGTGLSTTGEAAEIARSGKRSLQWDWLHHRITPNHAVNPQTYFFDNVLTYQNPQAFAGVGSGQSLGLWYKPGTPKLGHSASETNIPLMEASANAVLRLELLSGDTVIGRGCYYLTSSQWTRLNYPYFLAETTTEKPITGFRLIAPTHVPPDWVDCGPATLWLDDVNCRAKDADYNGTTIESFEAPTVPSLWRADDRGRIITTTERFKSGTRSLLWNWDKPDAALTFSDAKSFSSISSAGSLAFWVYNEKASGGQLRLELLCDDKVVGSCWYFLNYQGWRALAAPYGQIGWKPRQKVNGFRLIAPRDAANGRLYLDFFNFQCQGAGGGCYRPGTPVADYQQPWIGHPERLDKPESCRYLERDLSVNRPWLPPLVPVEKISKQELDDMEKLRAPILAAKTRVPAPIKPEALEALKKDLARWNIRRENGIVTGRAIGGVPSLNTPFDALPIRRDFADLINRTMTAYPSLKAHGNPKEADAMRQVCLDLVEHLVDQGLAMGNSNNNCPFISGDGGGGVNAERIFALREELVAAGLYDNVIRCMLYNSGIDYCLAQEPAGSTDIILVYYGPLYQLLLRIADPAERLQYLKTFRRALNRICSRVDIDPFGQDGTAFHHGMHHWSYTCYEIPVVLGFLQTFNNTCFRLDPAAYEILKKFTFTMAWSANKYTMPSPLLARPGWIAKVNMADFAGKLAECGTADGKESVERDSAGLFLALTDKPDGEPAGKYRAMGITPYKFEGHRVLNGTSASIHRRDDWMVAVIGMNQHVMGLELFSGIPYAGFARNGSISVVASGNPPSCEASGWRFEGWDSRHYPGATNKKARRQSVWFGWWGGVNNKSAFAGGTDLDGDGIWGYEHRTLGMKFNKSVFCFGNRITAITSDIERDDKDTDPFVTTLYQNAFAGEPSAESCVADGMEDKTFPSEKTLEPGKPHWLLDNKKTGYYIHSGAAPIKLMRHPQKWFYLMPDHLVDKSVDPIQRQFPSFKNDGFRNMPDSELKKYYKPTTGDFALAYFEHGAKPDATECVYSMLIKTTSKKMEEFAKEMGSEVRKEPPYRILEKSAKAHVLWDRDTKTTGYVLFNKDWSFQSPISNQQSTILHSVNRPCLVMLREESIKHGWSNRRQLKVSVASTDWKNATPIILTLNGRWQRVSTDTAREVTVVSDQKTTTITIANDKDRITVNYMPVHFIITKGGRPSQFTIAK